MLEKKIYVLGDEGCGKTSLLFALTGIEPNKNSQKSPTGHASSRRVTHVDVVTKLRKKRSRCCPCFSVRGPPQMSTSKEKLALVFFECVEQEARIRAMNYLDTDVILMCYDVSTFKSIEKLTKVWLPEVRYYCPDEVPILLVGLKGDKTKPKAKEPLKRRASSFFRVQKLDDTQREALRLTDEENIYAHLQCSVEAERGIDDLKNILAQAATTVTSRNKNLSPVLGGSNES